MVDINQFNTKFGGLDAEETMQINQRELIMKILARYLS